MAYSGFKGIGPNKLGCGDKGSPAKKYGAMKGDQSASRSDYKNYKGTDKGYHGKDGSSHGDQSASKADYNSPAKMYGGKKGDESKSKKDYESPAKQTAKQKANLPKQIVDAIAAKSPAKKNKGMSYDIKEASNQKLSASARKHYAENAQAANKSGYKG